MCEPCLSPVAGRITAVAATVDGMLLCTAAEDKALKVFDVLNFGTYILEIFLTDLEWFTSCIDMINMLRLSYTPSCCVWLYAGGAATAALAWSVSVCVQLACSFKAG